MTKPHFRLRLVVRPEHPPAVPERPLAPLTRAEKLVKAIAFLRDRKPRSRYVLDKGSSKPEWGVPYETPKESRLMMEVMEADRRRK